MKRRLLIVYSCLETLSVLLRVCRKLGFDVSTATDGEVAANEILTSMNGATGTRQYDMVFMDCLFMWQFFKVRQLGYSRTIIGLGKAGDIKETTRKDDIHSFDYVLHKPLTTKAVVNVFISYGFVSPLFVFKGKTKEEKETQQRILREKNKRLDRQGDTTPSFNGSSSSPTIITTLDPMLDACARPAFKRR